MYGSREFPALTDRNVRIDRTSSSDEDDGLADGWSIADDRRFRGTWATRWGVFTTTKLMIEIKGTLRASDTTAPTLTKADVGGASLVLTSPATTPRR